MKLAISDFCANREILEVLFAEKADLEHHYILSAHKQGQCCKKSHQIVESPWHIFSCVLLKTCMDWTRTTSKHGLYVNMFAVVSKHPQSNKTFVMLRKN